MITREHILRLAEEAVVNTPLYVTGVQVGAGNRITVFIDGDNGVTIDECVKVSRAIEGRLNRDEEDFALDVSSHGADSPLVMPRQYKRHIGRDLDVKLENGARIEGTLSAFENDGITLEWKEREPKPIGKGKHTVKKTRKIGFPEITEARIKLKF